MAAVGLSAFFAYTLIFIISMHTFSQNIHAQNRCTPSPSIASQGTINLRVGVPRKRMFTEFVNVSVFDNGTNYSTGFCVEVFRDVICKLNTIGTVNYSVQYIPFGDGTTKPNYDELVGNITAGQEFDAVVGDITITAERSKKVQFTQPFLDSGLVAVVRLRKEDNVRSGFAFLKPFTTQLWVLTVGFFTVGSLVLYLLESGENSAGQIWFSLGTLFTYQNDVRTVMGRIVVIAWLFVMGTLYSCYTANFSAILTAPRLEPTLHNIDTIMRRGVHIGVQDGSFVKEYLPTYYEIDKGRLIPLNTKYEYFDALSNGTVDAIIDERPYMESLVANHCDSLTFAGKMFTTQNWAFAFKNTHAELAQNISNIILNISEDSTLQTLQKKWLPYYHKDCSGYTQSGSDQIRVVHVWGLFVVSGAVTVIVLLIYLARWKWKAGETPPEGLEL